MEKINTTRIPDVEKPKNIDDFICKICTYIIYDPYECENCGIPYCKECITKWERISNQCPVKCDSVMRIKPAHRFIKKMLGELKIKCQNEACQTVTEISRMEYHLKECEYATLKCENEGCGEKILRKDYHEHNQICKFKLIQCERCTQTFRERDNDISSIKSHDCVKSFAENFLNMKIKVEILEKEQKENKIRIKELEDKINLLICNISYKCEIGHILTFKASWNSICATCGENEICTRWNCSTCEVNYCLNCIKILNYMCCPNAHPFSIGQVDEYLECDMCYMEFPYDQSSLHDRVCNFDICGDCVKNLFPNKI